MANKEIPKCKKCGTELERDGSKYVWKYSCGCEPSDTRLIFKEPDFLDDVQEICQISSKKGIFINCVDKNIKEIIELEAENKKLKKRITELEKEE